MEDLEQQSQVTPSLPIGEQMYQTQEAIHAGKLVLGELLAIDPVDEVAVAAERAKLHENRVSMNGLRRTLRLQKADSAQVWPKAISWPR